MFIGTFLLKLGLRHRLCRSCSFGDKVFGRRPRAVTANIARLPELLGASPQEGGNQLL